MRTIGRLSAAIFLLPIMAIAQEPIANPAFDAIKFFVGQWQGTTRGETGEGRGERRYEFVLGGKFLRGTNKTIYPAQRMNPKGEIHEDVGYFSYDRQQKRLVLRQFHVEGFVNEYAQQPAATGGKTLVFETGRIENIPAGWRARETYRIINRDEFIEVFELAEPKKDFAVYAEGRWRRAK